jgi:hypothetical protein
MSSRNKSVIKHKLLKLLTPTCKATCSCGYLQHVDATMKHAVGAVILELKLVAHMKQHVQYKLHLCIRQFLSETEKELWCHSLVNIWRESHVRRWFKIWKFYFPEAHGVNKKGKAVTAAFPFSVRDIYSLVSAFVRTRSSFIDTVIIMSG